MKIVEIDQSDINTKLSAYVGKVVCVYHSVLGIQRNQFCTQVCVEGNLEKHPEKDQYRIIVSDDTYAYFSSVDVLSIIDNDTKGRPNISIQAIFNPE